MNTRRTARRREANLRAVEPGQQVLDPSAIPVRQLRCRSGHHRFALDDWEPPAEIPRGVSVMFASEGRYKMLEPCLACLAATRVTYTHPGGGIDGYLKSGIIYGTNWVRMAMDRPRGRRVMRDEKVRRGRRQLDAFIGSAVTSLADEAREPGPVPRVPPVILRST
jgi:hypothetical protein